MRSETELSQFLRIALTYFLFLRYEISQGGFLNFISRLFLKG